MPTADSIAERPRVLVVDDDRELAAMLVALLERDGLRAECVHDARQAARAFEGRLPDLVLLDLMLPDTSGLEILRGWRARHPRLPVIMLTAKGDPVDRVVGLELGADDYVAKPFDARELVARVRAVLRRAEPGMSEAPCLRFGDAVLDFTARTFKVREVEVTLSAIEFRLLAALARRPGEVLSRETLTRAAQPGSYTPLERAVDVQIGRLRKKLREASPDAEWITTARGEGYAFAPPSESLGSAR